MKTYKKIQKQKTVKMAGKKSFKRLPDIETMFDVDGDPLEDVDFDPNDLEASATAEMSEIVRLIREKKKESSDRFRIANDTDYWVALCFQCREQRDEFLRKAGWSDVGEKYLNGLEIARRLGVDVEVFDLKPLPLRGKAKKFSRKEVI
jgi:hypothetical protein